MQLGIVHAHPALGTGCVELLAQRGVGPHPARDNQPLHAGGIQRPERLLDQHLDNGGLRAGRQIGPYLVARLATQLFHLREHGGLEAGKGEIEVSTVQQRTRQLVGLCVTEFGQPRERRPTRVTQSHQLGRLVEGFAGGIVDGFPEQGIAAYAVHLHQLRVAA